jgi:NADP-dependent aldehyde dehydrogenase
MIQLTGKNLIGKDEQATGQSSFRAQDPANMVQLEPSFTEAAEAEINMAVGKAEEAFKLYRKLSGQTRADFLETIAEEILGLGESLIKRCMAETALPEARLTGERMRTVNQLRLFASILREGSWVGARIDTAQSDRQPAAKPDIRQMQIPLGPVGIFGASNFPLAFSVAGGDTASALAAGCPVIVKAHPLHPGTSELVGTAILTAARKTSMPDGVFSMIHGVSVAVGMKLVRHPGIMAIGFTGSFTGGKAIFDAANQRERPVPVYAEMGSVNPVFILPGAMRTKADFIAAGLSASFTLGTGQFCTSPGLVFVSQNEGSQKFMDMLEKTITETGAGNLLSGTIKQNFLKGIKNLENTKGVSLLTCSSGEETGNAARNRVYVTEMESFLNSKSLSEEVFGPSTLIVNVKEKSGMLKIASELEGHLTATIHGTEEDLADYAELVNILENKAGRVIFNGFPTGVEVCHSMVHGGPFPATTAAHTTSVGTASIFRFSRPVCYQDFPQAVLPDALKNENPLNIWRMVDGEFTRDRLTS